MPPVSIIVPCYNEKVRIRLLLDAILKQSYPLDQVEVIIADGMSKDGTREIISRWNLDHPDLNLRVVDNIKKIIPSALNKAIENASGEIIIRLDSHSHPYPDYVARIVSSLQADLGENVGGVWEIRPGDDTWIALSISLAAAHPLGVGDALYRHGKKAGYVDTVPFGGFRRSLWEKLGGFDENLLTNEDYEFNARIIETGGRIWFDPEIKSVYYSRSTLVSLCRQYWRYGFWKYRMLKRFPKTIRWRQALPPLFVASILLGVLFSWTGIFLFLLVGELLLYSIILAFVGIQLSIKHQSISLVIGIPLSIASMHLSWGSGFLWSIVTGFVTR